MKENQASVSENTVQVNTKVEEPTQEDKENQPSTENPTSTELAAKEVKPEKETPQIHNQSETNAVVEPSENKESEKPELPMTKQKTINFIMTNQQSLLMTAGKNKPCQSEMEKWGKKFWAHR